METNPSESGSDCPVEDSNNNFIPATEWSLLPFEVQKVVTSWLSIEERVAFERVNETCAKISEELFMVQKYIPDECMNHRVIKRCPNLVELDFQEYRYIYDDAESRIEFVDNLYEWCPQIRSFRDIGAEDMIIVLSYLTKCRASDDFDPNSFERIDLHRILPNSEKMLLDMVGYKVRHIGVPVNLNPDTYNFWAQDIFNIDPDTVEKIEFGERSEDFDKCFCQYLICEMFKREDDDGQRINFKNLKSFTGILNQDLFDNLANCDNLKELIIIDTNYQLDISNLIKFSNLTKLSFTDFELGEIDDRNREAMINFLAIYGHQLRYLGLAIGDPNQDVMFAIRDNCRKLKCLGLWIRTKKSLFEIIPDMKYLKQLLIPFVKLTDADVAFIHDSIPGLTTLARRREDDDEESARGIISWIKNNYLFPIFILGHMSIVIILKRN